MTRRLWLVAVAALAAFLAGSQAWGQQKPAQPKQSCCLYSLVLKLTDGAAKSVPAAAKCCSEKGCCGTDCACCTKGDGGARCACAGKKGKKTACACAGESCCGTACACCTKGDAGSKCACAGKSCCGQACSCGTTACQGCATGMRGTFCCTAASSCCGTCCQKAAKAQTVQVPASGKCCCGAPAPCHCALCQKAGCCAASKCACGTKGKKKAHTKKVRVILFRAIPGGAPFVVVAPAPFGNGVTYDNNVTYVEQPTPLLPPAVAVPPMPTPAPPVYGPVAVPLCPDSAPRVPPAACVPPPPPPAPPVSGVVRAVPPPLPPAPPVGVCSGFLLTSNPAARAKAVYIMECRVVTYKENGEVKTMTGPRVSFLAGATAQIQVGPRVALRDGSVQDLLVPSNATGTESQVDLGNHLSARVTELGQDRVKVDLTLQTSEVDQASKNGIVIRGNTVRAVQKVRLGRVEKVVLKQDDKVTTRIEFKVTRGQN